MLFESLSALFSYFVTSRAGRVDDIWEWFTLSLNAFRHDVFTNWIYCWPRVGQSKERLTELTSREISRKVTGGGGDRERVAGVGISAVRARMERNYPDMRGPPGQSRSRLHGRDRGKQTAIIWFYDGTMENTWCGKWRPPGEEHATAATPCPTGRFVGLLRNGADLRARRRDYYAATSANSPRTSRLYLRELESERTRYASPPFTPVLQMPKCPGRSAYLFFSF